MTETKFTSIGNAAKYSLAFLIVTRSELFMEILKLLIETHNQRFPIVGSPVLCMHLVQCSFRLKIFYRLPHNLSQTVSPCFLYGQQSNIMSAKSDISDCNVTFHFIEEIYWFSWHNQFFIQQDNVLIGNIYNTMRHYRIFCKGIKIRKKLC